MKILIVTQYYWPENSKVTDIAENLVNLGNDVTVLTGLPNYPDGFIFDGYKKGKNRFQEKNGVTIIRAKLIERRHDIIHRFLNYYSFPFYASKMVKKLDKDFDVVLCFEESPIMLVRPAIKYAQKNKKKLIMYEMDLWPQSLIAGGIKKNGFIYKHFEKISAKIYSKCDKILVTTKEHIENIKLLPACKDLDIEYLPQYAETIFETSNYGYEENKMIDLMFAGNIGKAQTVGTIIRAANLLKDRNDIKFHIVGSGSDLETVKDLAHSLKVDNVIFYGNKPISEMPGLYRIADAMLVTLEDKEYANYTIPGKIQSYMAAGKPVIGSINGSCSNFIVNNNIGYVCESGNFEELAKIIRNLEITELRKIGEHSKEVYFKKYCKDLFFKKMMDVLEKHCS